MKRAVTNLFSVGIGISGPLEESLKRCLIVFELDHAAFNVDYYLFIGLSLFSYNTW